MIDDHTIAAIQTAPSATSMDSYVIYLRTQDDWQSAAVVNENRVNDMRVA